MRILELNLTNIKCFDSREIRFGPGVNFISGKNGAGKTTLVESIGLCLFGAGLRGGSTGYFLRDGEKSGSIEIRFAMNGEEYSMRRKIRAGSMPRRLFDGAGNELDLHGDADIDAYLRKELGLHGGQPLQELFHQIVGVRQGTLTQPFLQQPQERRQIFEAMLGVQRYQSAMKNAGGMPTFLLTKIGGHTTEIEVCRSHTGDMEETRTALAEARENLKRFEAAHQKAQTESDEAQAALSAIIARQESIEAEGKALAGARAQHAAQWEGLNASREADEASLALARKNLAEAEREAADLETAAAKAEKAAKAAREARTAYANESQAVLDGRTAEIREGERKLSAWEAKLSELRETARRAEGGKCPFLNIPCTSVPNLDEAVAERIKKNENAIRELAEKLAARNRAQTEAKGEREKELRRLEGEEKQAQSNVASTAAAAVKARSRIGELGREIERLTGAMTGHEKEENRLKAEANALAEREARHRAARAEADPAALTAAQARLQMLSQALGQAKEGMSGAQKDVERLQKALAEKEAYAKRLQEAEAARAKVQAVQELYHGLAGMLRNAGERMAAVYRERLGERATGYYRSISGDTARLQWMADYDIRLLDSHLGAARCRVFRQLSGGEQMSAALALRLALLTELAPMGLAFFDEPTANLDGTRREALAALLPKVTAGFEQVFVISHDDTFDSVGDHIVAL